MNIETIKIAIRIDAAEQLSEEQKQAAFEQINWNAIIRDRASDRSAAGLPTYIETDEASVEIRVTGYIVEPPAQ